jgi:polyribonucleotide nucleotidyltransferase
MQMQHTVDIDLDGLKITLETGKIAKQAHGAVVVRSGDSVVLVTACSNEEPKPGAGFFPLTVDYREYTYAAGKFPGGFIKREGRPSEKEILTSRLIDRPIRPLFPEGYMNETQVIAMVLSADPENDPGVLAIIGAGAALAISDVPFEHVLGGVKVGSIDGKFIPNPTYEQARSAKINIVVAGTEGGIVMVEAGAQHASEAEVLEAIEYGHNCCKKIAAGIRELVKKAGKPKRKYVTPEIDKALYGKIETQIRAELTDALDTKKYPKLESYHRVHEAMTAVLEALTDEEKAAGGVLFGLL